MISSTLISDLRATTKPGEKHEVLKKSACPFLEYLLKATYDPFKLYHVKLSAKDIPPPGKEDINSQYIRTLLSDTLKSCTESNSSKINKELVRNALSYMDKDTQDLFFGVINKNWKAGISSKSVEELFPGAVPSFDLQLSNSYLKVIKKKTYKPKTRFGSYKLDGVRCVSIRLGKDDWVSYSRQGHPFLTVDHLKPQLEARWKATGITWWDGELHVDGLSFEEIQGMVMRFTQGTSEALEYKVFMCGFKEAFLNKEYSAHNFKTVEDEHVDPVSAPKIIRHPQWLIKEEDIMTTLEEAFELGHEGIMLRDPELLYDFKRSDALLKLKESDSASSQEETSDVLVTDIVTDMMPVVEDGAMVFKKLLTKLIVLQKNGVVCTVGSGFSLDFREYYTANPEEIKEKVIEAKHQGYGRKGRMRFPRLFRVREDLSWED